MESFYKCSEKKGNLSFIEHDDILGSLDLQSYALWF